MKVTVVGAGFSGLVTAYYLTKAGFEVEIFEKNAKPGGLISTRETPWGLVETAANALINSRLVEDLFEDLNLELLGTLPASRSRYIYRDKPRRWPLSLPGTLKAMSGGLGVLRRSARLRPHAGETIRDWGLRVFGSEVTSYLLEPALQGIYSGDPSRMSASLLVARFFESPDNVRNGQVRPKTRFRGSVAPRGGMGALIQALDVRLREKGVQIHYEKSFELTEGARPVVICTSALAAAEILKQNSPSSSRLLSQVEVLPVVTVTAFFKPTSERLKGFGVLFPKGEGFSALGVLMNHNIFDGRSSVISETWIFGGARDPDFGNQSDAQIAAKLDEDRRKLHGTSGERLEVSIQRWPHAIPHYTVELERILSAGFDLPLNVFLMGNYLGGIGLGRILDRAHGFAQELQTRYLQAVPLAKAEGV